MGYTTIKITDKKLIDTLYPYLINDKCCVAGGFFKDYYSDKKCKDIDIYCEDDMAVKEVKAVFNRIYKKDFETENITRYHNKQLQIEVITKLKGTPEKIIDEFDFTICKFAVYKKSNTFYAAFCDEFFVDLHRKAISTQNCKMPYPTSTLKRLVRYVSYGFVPTKDALRDVIIDINSMCEDEIDDEFYTEECSHELLF